MDTRALHYKQWSDECTAKNVLCEPPPFDLFEYMKTQGTIKKPFAPVLTPVLSKSESLKPVDLAIPQPHVSDLDDIEFSDSDSDSDNETSPKPEPWIQRLRPRPQPKLMPNITPVLEPLHPQISAVPKTLPSIQPNLQSYVPPLKKTPKPGAPFMGFEDEFEMNLHFKKEHREIIQSNLERLSDMIGYVNINDRTESKKPRRKRDELMDEIHDKVIEWMEEIEKDKKFAKKAFNKTHQ